MLMYGSMNYLSGMASRRWPGKRKNTTVWTWIHRVTIATHIFWLNCCTMWGNIFYNLISLPFYWQGQWMKHVCWFTYLRDRTLTQWKSHVKRHVHGKLRPIWEFFAGLRKKRIATCSKKTQLHLDPKMWRIRLNTWNCSDFDSWHQTSHVVETLTYCLTGLLYGGRFKSHFCYVPAHLYLQ